MKQGENTHAIILTVDPLIDSFKKSIITILFNYKHKKKYLNCSNVAQDEGH